MADSIEVCSYLMGSNKTNMIIQWMQENSQERYIYVIPNLSEITNDEVESRVLSIGFKTPNTDIHKTKSESLKDLLKQGDVNIACTQHLYKMIDKECLALIKKNRMIVVFDEEISLIDVYNYASPSDLISLLNDGNVYYGVFFLILKTYYNLIFNFIIHKYKLRGDIERSVIH